MAKHSKNKRKEKQEIAILNLLLNSNPLRTELTSGEDDVPLIDGYVHLLGENDEVGGSMLKVQIKPLKTNKDGSVTATCGIDLLDHAHSSSLPVLLVGVDVESQTAYWTYLSPESVKILHEAQVAAGKQSSTIRFHKNHIIKKDVDAYIAEWKRICGHHRNMSNDRLAARYKRRIRKSLITANEDTLLERIRTFHDLVHYRTNKGEYPLVEVVLEMARTIGGASATVKIAYIELLQRLMHDKTTEVLDAITKLATDENEEVRKKAGEALKNAAKYNYHVLNAIGYGPYRLMVDFIASHDVPTDIAHEMFRNLLGADFDGTSETAMYTLTFHRGTLDATPYLKKIRRDVIELLLKRYESEKDAGEKKKIVETIGHATYKTDAFSTNDDFITRSVEMVEADTAFVVKAYEKIIFPEGKMTALYPVVYEVESQVSLLATRQNKITGVEELLQRIRGDMGDYRLFSLLAGDEMRLRHDVEWQDGEKQKRKELDEIFNAITEDNAEDWFKRIAAVARFGGSVDDWLLHTLREFLMRLGEEKPAVAEIFIRHAFKDKDGLYPFVRTLLWGLRKSSLKQWDVHVQYIIDNALSDQVAGVLLSLHADQGADLVLIPEKIREQDIDLVLEVAERRGRFAFLQSEAVDRSVQYQTVRTLVFLSGKDKRLRSALVEKIKNIPSGMEVFYGDQLSFAVHGKRWIDLAEWDVDELDHLADMLVRVKGLGHDELQVIHALGTVNPDLVMSVFERRIKHPYGNGYDSIPFHFDQGVAELIRNNPRSKDIVQRWVQEFDPEEDSLVGYHLGEFFEHVGGTVLREALSELIATKKKENIMRVLDMLPRSEQPDLSLCLEIVAATNDEDILSMIDSRMRHTGGGSGAAGENIFGREMRNGAERIKQAMAQSKDPKVIKFCEKVLANLAQDIARSDQDHERRMREERQEYEDEHPKE